MSDPFVGELRLMSFSRPPKGWAVCNGQLLPVNQNQALFALLGTSYGGNGSTTFGLPNLQGRVPLGFSSQYPIGATAGTEGIALTIAQTPAHTHGLNASSAVALAPAAGGTSPGGGKSVAQAYIPPNTANLVSLYGQGGADRMMNAATVASVGGQSHENRQPLLVLNYCIALTGVYPSRS